MKTKGDQTRTELANSSKTGDRGSQAPKGSQKTALGANTDRVQQTTQSSSPSKNPRQTRKTLQATIKEVESLNHELTTVKQELFSINDDIRSTQSERWPSKKLHSINETLTAINTELQDKVEQLSQAYRDISNLLRSTEIATILLSSDELRIKHYTPAAKELFNITQLDIGRPLADLPEKLLYDGVLKDAQYVLKYLVKREKEVRTRDGSWYIARLLPYHPLDNSVEGVVVTFVDITDRRRAEEETQLLLTLTRDIANSDDFNAALGAAISGFCEAAGWDYGEAWIPNQDQSKLELSPAWYSSSEKLKAFRDAARKNRFAKKEGLPGRIWVSAKPEWYKDISSVSETTFKRAQLAAKMGLCAALGVPVLDHAGKVAAVLSFLMFEATEENQRQVNLVSAVASQLGAALQRKRAEEELSQTRNKLEHRVKERTQELATANKKLEAAIEKRKQFERQLQNRLQQQKIVTQLGQMALRGIRPSTLMQRAVKQIAKVLDIEYCKVLELLADNKNLLLRAGVGWKKGSVGKVTVGADISSQAGFTLRSDRPVIVTDLRTEKRFRGPQLLRDHNVVSGISVIINGFPKPYGVLGAHTTGKRKFSKDDVHFIQGVANVISMAVSHHSSRELSRKHAAESLRLAAIVESSDDAIIGKTLDGIILSWNQGAERIYGYTPQEVIGRSIAMLVPPERADEISFIRETLKRGERIEQHETVRLTKEGKRIDVALTISVMKNEDGKIIGASTIARNITDQKRAEAALRESQKTYETLVNSIDGIVWEADAYTLQFSFVSKQADRLLGYPVERWLHDEAFWQNHIHPEDKEWVMRSLTESVREKKDHEFEYRMISADGHIVWLRVLVTVVLKNNKPTKLTGVMVDSTKRKLAEEKLKRYAEQLEASNRELDQFATVASHDLQEPLRKIEGFGERLCVECRDALGDRGQDYLGRMLTAVVRMRSLVTDLLTYSRLTADARPFTEIDLNVIAQEVLSDLELRVQEIDARIKLSKLPKLEADPLQMRQLLQNLLSNSLKFHRKDVRPTIKIFSRRVTKHSLEISNNRVAEIIVQDNGIGFSEHYGNRIFNIFERLHSHSEYEGTGMGLALCRKIVEHHSGTITAKGKEGKGTSFIITLPLTHKA